MRIGVFGGTFDPPHAGHLALAKAAMQALELDEILFVPTSKNPLKSPKGQTHPKQRLEMVRIATRDEKDFAVSDIEISRGGLSYAVDTMSELGFLRPAEYWFLCGADTLKTLMQWKNPDKLLRMCRLGVVLRSPQTKEQVLAHIPEDFQDKIDWIEMPPVDVSATDLRYKIHSGKPTNPWIDPKVLEYIEKNKLYRS